MSKPVPEPDFRVLFEAVPGAYLVLLPDPDFTILAASNAYLLSTMTRREEILGLPLFEAFPSNAGDPAGTGVNNLRASLTRVLATGQPHTMALQKYDIRRPPSEGGGFEERFWSPVNSAVLGADGTVQYLIHRVEDVTDYVRLRRREQEENRIREELQTRTGQVEAEIVQRVEELQRANRSLAESEQRYRTLQEQAAVWRNRYEAAASASRQLLYDWNPFTDDLVFAGDLQGILGYTEEEMRGGLARWIELVHPDDREAFSREIGRVKKTEEPFTLDFRVVRKDGGVIYCEDRGNFFRNARDEVVRMVGFVADVTERRRTEEALRASRERLSLAQLAGGVGVFDWQVAEGRVLWTPELERLYGLPEGTFEGSFDDWRKRVLPEDGARVVREIEQCVRERRREYAYEFRAVLPDGALRWLAGHARFFYDPHGQPVRMIGVNVDIDERKKAEAERERLLDQARRSEERLRAAMFASGTGTFRWEMRSDAVHCDEAMNRLFGLPSAQTDSVLRDFLARVHPDDRQRLAEGCEKCRAEGVDFDMEYRVVWSDGSEHWLLGKGKTYPGPDGGSAYMAGACVDITGRKRAEAALRESEQRLHLAVAIAQMGTFDIDLLTDAVMVNEIGREIYGWEPGQPLTFGLVQGHFHPDDREEVLRRVEAAFDPEGPGEFEVEQRIIRVDGQVRWIRVRGRALFEGEGAARRAVRCVGTYLDITEGKQTEEALRKSEERFRDLADNISQLAWMTDETGWIFWYNRRWFEYTGTTLEEMRGWGWRTVHHPDHRDRVEEKFRRCVEAGEPWEDMFPLRGADGHYRWFLSRAMPIRNADGRVIRWFGTNTDVTEQRNAEQALREREERLAELNTALAAARDEALAASAAKSTFLATMSHELRTPLNAIIGYAELLREDVEHGSPDLTVLAMDLDRITSSGRHLLGLINDVLDFSKIDAGRMELAEEEVEIERLIHDAVAAVAPQNAARGNRLLTEQNSGLRSIRGDFMRLKQVLINLLSNAAKFTENGEIRLGCRMDSGDGARGRGNGALQRRLLFTVSDTGIGISSEQLPLLFESFRQLDTSSTRRHGGTGLGLAITKRLVELMGGQIEVQSERGKGTTFLVSLPLRPE